MTSDPAIYDYMNQSKNGEGGIYDITNLNLYHYAGNNPIKYTDPDGRFLYAEGDDAFLRKVADNIREICPSAAIIKIDDNLAIILVDQNHIPEDNDYPEGTNLITGLAWDENNDVTIKPSSGGNQHQPSSKTVLFNPSGDATILTLQEDGTASYENGRPSYVGLAHELIHALHNIKGVRNTHKEREATGLDGRTYNFMEMYNTRISYEELATVGGINGFSYGESYPTENSIRVEHGLKKYTLSCESKNSCKKAFRC